MYDRVLIIPALVCSRTALANDRQPSHTHEQTLGDFHPETSAKQCQITVKTLELNGHHIYIKPLYFPEDRKEHLKEVKSLDQKKKKHRVQDSGCQSGNKPDLNHIERLPHPAPKPDLVARLDSFNVQQHRLSLMIFFFCCFTSKDLRVQILKVKKKKKHKNLKTTKKHKLIVIYRSL